MVYRRTWHMNMDMYMEHGNLDMIKDMGMPWAFAYMHLDLWACALLPCNH